MARIDFYQDAGENNEWRWRVTSSNGQNIGKSLKGWSTEAEAKNNLTAIATMAIASNIKIAASGEGDANPKFPVEFYKDESEGEEWRWRVRTGDGNQVGASEEGFTRKENAQKNLENLVEAIKAWQAKGT